MESNKRLSNCHRLEEAKETGQRNASWYPELDPGTEKEQ